MTASKACGYKRAGVLWFIFRQRQQTLRRDTLVRHRAEEPAGRHAGIIRKYLNVVACGKPLARLPRIDGGNGKAQIAGDLLQRDAVLPAPVAERGRKAGADVAVKFGF